MSEEEENVEIKRYFDQMKDIYDHFLLFIDNPDTSSDEDYNNLQQVLDKYNIQENKELFGHFIKLIISIANDHHRQPCFFEKIERIILKFQNALKTNNTSIELYEQFKDNKRLLYFLIKEQILTLDTTIDENSDFFLTENTKSDKNNFNQNDERLLYYLDHLDEYEEKRRIGENDSYVCSLIRQDSVEEFIKYVNQNVLPLSSRIAPSIFETNRFLIDKNPTLIEYAAFFGSIQIFQYLYLNKVEIDGSLWLYGIHSNNPDLLRNYIESNKIEPTDKTYEESLIESIRCHHNDIAKYIEDNLIDKSELSTSNYEYKEATEFDKHFFESSLKYQNYSFISTDFDKGHKFFYLYKYNFQNIVDIFIQSRKEYFEDDII